MRALPVVLAALLTAAPAPAQPPTPAPAPAVAVAIEAVGLVRSRTPGRSVAILRSQGRTRVVAEGETAFGARLVGIGAESVTIESEGRTLELRLTSAPAFASAPPPPPPALPPGAPPEDPETPAREMDRRQVQARLGEEMTRILAETAMAPVMEEGRIVGMQVTRIPEGSLLTDAGLRAGDVVTRINDTEIDGMATLIGLWPRLQGATELRAVVLRGGQPVSLLVSLR
jgi:type II secretion system protein C